MTGRDANGFLLSWSPKTLTSDLKDGQKSGSWTSNKSGKFPKQNCCFKSRVQGCDINTLLWESFTSDSAVDGQMEGGQREEEENEGRRCAAERVSEGKGNTPHREGAAA